MNFHVITVLPRLFPPYLGESVLGRGVSRGLIRVWVHDLRDFTQDKHHKVDDKPYGGGPGMVLGEEPLVGALRRVLRGKNRKTTKVLITDPTGKQFDHRMARHLACKYKDVIIIAGRYEGVDARVIGILKNGFGVRVEKVSAGPYVLTGGELPALMIIDAVARHTGGVLGKRESLEENRLGVGVPVYTRPEDVRFKGGTYRVPGVLLSGDHKQIVHWRRKNQKKSP